jgi:hypothetical protein
MTSRPLIASPAWTAEEEKQLRGLAKSGARPATIAKLLERTEQAVRHRFYKLGIPLKRTDLGLSEPKWRLGNGPKMPVQQVSAAWSSRAEGQEVINGIRRPWTISEDDLLRKMATSGERIAAIALRLQKTEDAVRSRAFRLRISLNALKAKGK